MFETITCMSLSKTLYPLFSSAQPMKSEKRLDMAEHFNWSAKNLSTQKQHPHTSGVLTCVGRPIYPSTGLVYLSSQIRVCENDYKKQLKSVPLLTEPLLTDTRV